MSANSNRSSPARSASRIVVSLLALAASACGGGYGGGGGNASQPPTARLSVQPTSINIGESATLTWSTTNANSSLRRVAHGRHGSYEW